MFRTLSVLAVITALCAGFLVGRLTARNPERHMNDLMSVGFRIIDPEGCDVESWNE